jgi:molybdenum cofactor biosynthesis enzyme MoaA
MLRTCLFSEVETNLLPYLRGGASDEEILAVIDEAIIEKPQGHEISEKEIAKTCARTMSHIGG